MLGGTVRCSWEGRTDEHVGCSEEVAKEPMFKLDEDEVGSKPRGDQGLLWVKKNGISMVRIFDREFNHLDEPHIQELRSLETRGCIFTEFWRDEDSEFRRCRIRFEPDEIVGYVDALKAYDDFLGHLKNDDAPEEALEKVTPRIRRRVKEYNQWAEKEGQPDTKYSPAAFIGGELESLVCGTRSDRYEFIQKTYAGDRRYLLEEIIEGFEESFLILGNRDGSRPDFEIDCEQDFQDLFYSIMKPIFPDARSEEYTPKHGGNSKRIDFVIPEISTVIEAKYVRNESHAKDVADELRIDIESYHEHTDCNEMVAVVWDDESLIPDKSNFENDLTGPREIDGTEFRVKVHVLP